jgi:hypothetical protein
MNQTFWYMLSVVQQSTANTVVVSDGKLNWLFIQEYVSECKHTLWGVGWWHVVDVPLNQSAIAKLFWYNRIVFGLTHALWIYSNCEMRHSDNSDCERYRVLGCVAMLFGRLISTSSLEEPLLFIFMIFWCSYNEYTWTFSWCIVENSII